MPGTIKRVVAASKKSTGSGPKVDAVKRDTVRTSSGEILTRSIQKAYIGPGKIGNDTTYTHVNSNRGGGNVSASSSSGPSYKYKELEAEFKRSGQKKKR
jgi:hypothetical protein